VEECGGPKVDDFNLGDNEGSAYFHVIKQKGVRWSALLKKGDRHDFGG